MVYTHPDPGSIKLDTETVQANSRDRQAAARAAYIESLLADWPAPTPQQQRTVSHLLANATPNISTGQYQSWELKRYEDAGKHGFFGDEVAA